MRNPFNKQMADETIRSSARVRMIFAIVRIRLGAAPEAAPEAALGPALLPALQELFGPIGIQFPVKFLSSGFLSRKISSA